MGEVTISVAGRAYQVVCEDGEENRLAAIAARVDHEAQAFGGATPSLSESRLLLMCALLLADKLDEVETAPQAAPPPPSAMNADPAEVDTSAVEDATARIEALTLSSGSAASFVGAPSSSGAETEPAAEAEAEVSPEPANQPERRSKSSAATAAERDLLSWADRSEAREEARAADQEAEAETEAAESVAADTAPAPEDAAEDDDPAESEAERSARERSDRRKRRRERLARLAREESDDT